MEKNTEFVEKLVHINRITKVVKGGRRFGFSALVVVGNQNGKIGVVVVQIDDRSFHVSTKTPPFPKT